MQELLSTLVKVDAKMLIQEKAITNKLCVYLVSKFSRPDIKLVLMY